MTHVESVATMPVGQYAGAAAWHPQTAVTAPPESTYPAAGACLEVDEALAALMVELWRRGVETEASCQNAPHAAEDHDEEESGEAHIQFASVEAARWFADGVGQAAMVHREPGTSYPEAMCVAFPCDDVEAVTSRLLSAAD